MCRQRDLTRRALPIEKPDDDLDEIPILWKLAARPRRSEVGEIPTFGHETVKALSQAQYRFDGVVGEVVAGEEARLSAFLSLPGGRTV